MKRTSLIATAIVLGLAAAWFIRGARAITAADAELARLNAERQEWSAKVAMLEEKLARTRARVEAPNQTAASAPAAERPGEANATAAVVPRIAPATQLTPLAKIANDPVRMAEYLQEYRSSLDLAHGAMFRRFNLSPEQIEKAKDLLVWYKQSQMDLQVAAELNSLNLTGDGYDKLRADLRHERLRREGEVFGADHAEVTGTKYVLNDSLKSTNDYLRETVRRIASIDMGDNVPATYAQVERATNIILANGGFPADVDPTKKNWQLYGGWGFGDWDKINWAAAEPQLQEVLSPAQYTALRQFMHTQETWIPVANRNAANQREAALRSKQPGG